MSDNDEIRVALGNLPPDVTEEDIHDELEHLGYEFTIFFERSGNEDRVTAVITFDGMTRNAAKKLAEQLNGMIYRDRTLRSYVPLFLA